MNYTYSLFIYKIKSEVGDIYCLQLIYDRPFGFKSNRHLVVIKCAWLETLVETFHRNVFTFPSSSCLLEKLFCQG